MKVWSSLILFFSISSCSFSQSSFESEVQKLTKSFKSKLITVETLRKNKSEYIILDAREKSEYVISHIQNAIHIGYDNFDLKSTMSQINKNKTIVVYCSVGYRSGEIADKLIAQGLDVKNLFGGIFDWKNKGFSVYNPSGQETDKVHTYNKSWSKWLTAGEKVY